MKYMITITEIMIDEPYGESLIIPVRKSDKKWYGFCAIFFLKEANKPMVPSGLVEVTSKALRSSLWPS